MDAVDKLISELLSEHQNILDYVQDLQEQRGEWKHGIRAKTAGPVLQSLKETFEVVRLMPLQEQILTDNLQWSCRLYHGGSVAQCWRRRTRLSF